MTDLQKARASPFLQKKRKGRRSHTTDGGKKKKKGRAESNVPRYPPCPSMWNGESDESSISVLGKKKGSHLSIAAHGKRKGKEKKRKGEKE